MHRPTLWPGLTLAPQLSFPTSQREFRLGRTSALPSVPCTATTCIGLCHRARRRRRDRRAASTLRERLAGCSAREDPKAIVEDVLQTPWCDLVTDSAGARSITKYSAASCRLTAAVGGAHGAERPQAGGAPGPGGRSNVGRPRGAQFQTRTSKLSRRAMPPNSVRRFARVWHRSLSATATSCGGIISTA